jgi:uncharacterized protein YggL (DUF469 family)
MAAPCPVLGFVVRMELAPHLGADPRGERWGVLWDAWIVLLEGRGLSCGGGGGDVLEYVVTSDAAQATESDRAAVRDWLGARDDLRTWSVGELVDLDDGL